MDGDADKRQGIAAEAWPAQVLKPRTAAEARPALLLPRFMLELPQDLPFSPTTLPTRTYLSTTQPQSWSFDQYCRNNNLILSNVSVKRLRQQYLDDLEWLSKKEHKLPLNISSYVGQLKSDISVGNM